MISLREAIQASNSNAAVNSDTVAGEPAATAIDSITFADGLSTIVLGSELEITESLQIALGDSSDQIISGDNASRIFAINASVGDAVSVDVSGLTLQDGVAESGGAIYVGSGQSLSLTDVTLTGNTATGDDADMGGGALAIDGGNVTITDSTISGNIANGASGSGGGILNLGTLTVSGGEVSDNTANRAGGGIEATAGSSTTLTDVLMELNVAGPDGSAAPGNGGALHISGDGNADISGGTIRDNMAAREGGGLWNNTGAMTVDGTILTGNIASGDAADDGGGAIFNNGGTLTVSNAIISGNAADGTLGSGGGIFSTDGAVTINLSQIGGSIASEGNTANRAGGGIEVIDGTVTLNFGTDVSNNFAGINGGGLHSTGAADVTSNLAIFGSNTAASEGGGLWNSSTGTMTINGGAISSNVASGDDASNGGGGLFNDGGTLNVIDAVVGFNVADGASGSGGGILNEGGTLTISGNTNITNNTANRAGGGIEVTGGSTTTITDALISSNLAGVSPAVAAPGNGGGIHVGGDGSVTITGGSVTDNEAIEGGGLWNSAAGSLTVDGTTISGNTAVAGGGVYNDEAPPLADQMFSMTFESLNGSGVSGTGMVIVQSPSESTRTVRVVIDAEGLQDLSGIPGAIHVAHIHGQFAGNATLPILSQGDGPFFDGAGGTANGFPPVNSVAPSLANDDGRTIADGFLDFLEGRPQYGPVVLNLTSTQLRDAAPNGSNPPDGVPPLSHFLALAGSGDIDAAALFPNGTEFNLDTTYTFDLTNADEERQFNNLAPLGLREVVLHGQTIDTAISDAIDAAAMGTAPSGVDLGDGTSFRVTAPVAVALITPVSGSVTITNATITNNTATGDEATEGGGGIHNSGSLSVSDSEISGNTASGAAGSGGGVWNAGIASIQDSEISGNTANRAGGGIEATDASSTSLTDVNLDGNNVGVSPAVAAPGNGGGLHVTGAGTVTISGGTVNNNVAASEGGGLWNGTGVMTVTGTTISGNSASGDDADNGGGGLFNVGGNLIVTDTTITGNVAEGASGSGGGILNQGTLTVSGGEISSNIANRAGGGIEVTGGSTTTITDALISANLAGVSPAVAAPGNGGGIHVGGDGSVTISGGSVTDNEAIEGGGLWNSAAGLLTVDGTTISGNTAVSGGGVYNDEAAPLADQMFSMTFESLNGSGVSGIGMVIVQSPSETTRTVRVVIDAEGLQDLSGIPGAIHVAHIHGQFAGNATLPILSQGDGPFFDGAGGTANGFPPVNSVAPSLANDDGRTIADGFLDFLEGRPQYGPVVLNLTSTQLRDAAPNGSNPPDGVPPLSHFLALAGSGDIDAAALFPNGTEFNLDTTYTFDLTNADEERQFNNLAPLGLREVVLHGQTIDTAISDAIDAAAMGTAPSGVDLGDGTSFRVTAPVAVALITPVSGSVTITNATITNNTATGDEATEGGGGIHNSGSLSVSDSEISGNTASGAAGSGGGVWNAGIASVQDSEISGNTANRAGGGIEATDTSSTSLTDVNLDGNNVGVSPAVAAPGNGGGLHVTGAGTVTISGGTVNNNVAASEGGGLWNGTGVMTVTGTTITGNTASGDDADNGGGGLFNVGGNLIVTDTTITGNVADGASGSGGGILNQGTLTVSGGEISSNTANRAGGAIEVTAASTTTLTDVAMDQNVAGPGGSAAPGNGGALHISGDGVVTIAGGTVTDNVAANEGGGLWNSVSGSLTVDGTSVSGNSAPIGGGIFNDSGVDATSQTFETTLSALNDSGVSGTASVTVDTTDPDNPSITVNINASGLVPNQPHIQHIHGRFASDLDSTDTIPGPFLGEGGVAIDSRTPDAGDDANGDGFITVGEGLAGYGNVLLNLSSPRAPVPLEGNSPLADFNLDDFPTAEDGTIDFSETYTFDLSDADQARQYNNLLPMSLREIVLHGVNTDIDVDGDGSPDGYRVTGPAAAGTLQAVGGTLTVVNAQITGNTASGNGGGIANESGTVSITDTTISGNVSGGDEPGEGGGGVFNDGGTVTITDSDVFENTAIAGLGNGGGILNANGGTLVVRGGTISNNDASRAGGGVENAGNATFFETEFDGNTTGINGGALHTSGPWTASFIDATITGNSAGAEGGGVWNSSTGTMTFVGASVDGNTASGDDADQGGGGVFNDGGTLTIDSTSITNNIADGMSGSGGGILNLGSMTVTDSTISGNVANRAGGGIEATDASSTLLNDVNLDGNNVGVSPAVAAPGNGGGLHVTGAGTVTISGGTVNNNVAASEGGGLWNGTGVMTVTGTTITGNTASGDDADNGGGGLFNVGGTLNVTDSTIAENVADGVSGSGGGILNQGTLTVSGGEISDNAANRAGGGIEATAGSSTTLTDVLMELNVAGPDGSAAPGNGGALHISGDGNADISGGTIRDNSAAREGGGLWNNTGTMTVDGTILTGNVASGDAADDGGGAIFNNGGTLTVSNATISGNAADGVLGSGGAIFSTDGAVTISSTQIGGAIPSEGNTANRAGGGIEVIDGTVTLNFGTDVSSNSAGINGGGLHSTGAADVTSNFAIFGSNTAASEGGGLWNSSTGTMTINGGAISSNVASGDDASNGGGGLFNDGGTLNVIDAVIGFNVADGASGSGGGILNDGGTLTISGNTTISNNTANRAGGGIEVTGGTINTITGATISSNSAGVSPAVAAPGNGGGIHVGGDGQLTISGGSVTGNSAALEGGGLWNGSGLMTINGTTITGNTALGDGADDGGGGVFNNGGSIEITNGSISGNVASGSAGSGGGLLNFGGSVEIAGTTISGNRANRAGGGIEATADSSTTLLNVALNQNNVGVSPATAAPGNGGGLHITGNGSAEITGGTVNGNVAASEGGGLWNGSGTMTVDGTVIDGNAASGDDADNGGGGIFNVGGTLVVSDATIQNNVADGASGSGGGIFNAGTATIDNTTVSGNTANRAGGGLEAIGGSSTSIIGGSLEDNVAGPGGSAAPGNGGAIHISDDGSVDLTEVLVDGNTAASEGGGLWNSSTGTLVVTRSTISNNVTIDGGGIFADGDGGAVTVVSSTIASNSASNDGGGVLSEGGTVALTSVTIADNTASLGGGISVEAGTLSLINSIVSRNNASTDSNLSGSFTDDGNNLVDVDAGLGTLGDFGGPTATIPLLAGSAALDAGVLAGLTTDQRGVSRPQGPGVDIGAFESDLAAPVAAALSIAADDAQRVEGDSGTTAFTFTVTRSENTTGTVTVDYSVVGDGDNPADASDFGGTLPTGTVTFADGDSTATITVNVSGDTQVEPNEGFTVVLSNASDDTVISQTDAEGIILNDDINERETRILVPTFVARPHLIPGDGIPTAIIFQALTDTTVTVTPISVTSLSETVRIVDADTLTVSAYQNGVATANLQAGELYAVIFEPLSSDRIFSIRSSAGSDTLTNRAATNILQPTDTSADGETTALDALVVINELNRLNDAGGEPLVGSFVDVNRDASVTALDALLVINHLNRMELSTNTASGEFIAPQASFGNSEPNELLSNEVDEFFDSGEVIGVDEPASKVSLSFDGSSSTAAATPVGVDEAMAELDAEDASSSVANEIELLGAV
uniref:choice-of-anchor Q domain-containing protein n=1 Tax=Rhodopirellula bahusiensis TaxID=2014065 RepID=UPI0036F37329